ncbi:MAG: toll/interleukin-1 receptor domain-containing protein [Cyanobacteria bacterium P01_A01_bin.116]
MKKTKVFISHSSIDTWVATQIAKQVQKTGADTFLDEADIEHGDDFDNKIVDASKQCTELLLLLTPWSVQRPYIWLEIGFFRYDNKRIVGILHGLEPEDISGDPRIPVLLKKIDLVDINDIESYFSQLHRRVTLVGDSHKNEI